MAVTDLSGMQRDSNARRSCIKHRTGDGRRARRASVCAACWGELDAAIDRLMSALGLRPDFAAALFMLAQALWMQGRVGSAAERLREGLSLMPGSVEAHNSLGLLYKACASTTPRSKLRQGPCDQPRAGLGALQLPACAASTAQIRRGDRQLPASSGDRSAPCRILRQPGKCASGTG